MTPEDIARIAVREQDFDNAEARTAAADSLVAQVKAALAQSETIPAFSSSSRPLSVVRFRALLQDTGYPAEVYLPSDVVVEDEQQVDWSKLSERWVGWGVEVPGEQTWAKAGTADLAEGLEALSLSSLPPPVKDKFPIAGQEYTGALVKVYSDFAPSPASVYEIIGVVSSAPMPSPYNGNDEEEEPTLVPAIHALLPPQEFQTGSKPSSFDTSTRSELVSYLASAFSPPDEAAGELLLLALLSTPAARPTALPPLGTFNINLIRAKTTSPALDTILSSLAPHTLSLSLTLPLLHSAHFRPSSTDGTSLTPGLLQLAPGTLLQINEDGLGAGGALATNALENLKALTEALSVQSVHYAYPYMDSLRINCALRSVITSEGKSLLPADVVLPVVLAESAPQPTDAQLSAFRTYLASHGSLEHAKSLTIPDSIAEAIQDQFVAERKEGGSVEAAEARLKRRMKIARVLALSCGDALTPELWERARALDEEVERRNVEKEEKRREGKIGAPTVPAEIELE